MEIGPNKPTGLETQRKAPPTVPVDRILGGSVESLDALKKRKVSYHCLQSNHSCLVVQPLA